jgi:hypothetical protein
MDLFSQPLLSCASFKQAPYLASAGFKKSLTSRLDANLLNMFLNIMITGIKTTIRKVTATKNL